MSYFSHNPEAWDEIERKGVAEYIAGHMQDDELVEGLTEALAELQLAAESHHVWDELTKLAARQVDSAQGDFWSDQVDAAMARADV